MANKRDFKKCIDEIGASVCNDMMVAYYNIPGADRDKIASAIEKVLTAITNAKNNANVYFDRGAKAFEDHKDYSKAKAGFFKALFNKIDNEFAEELSSAVKDFNSAIPEAAKAKNKENAAE